MNFMYQEHQDLENQFHNLLHEFLSWLEAPIVVGQNFLKIVTQQHFYKNHTEFLKDYPQNIFLSVFRTCAGFYSKHVVDG